MRYGSIVPQNYKGVPISPAYFSTIEKMEELGHGIYPYLFYTFVRNSILIQIEGGQQKG